MRAAAALGLLTFLSAGAAGAAPASVDPRFPGGAPRPATQCLDTLGQRRPPVCRNLSGSRIVTAPDICLCGAGLRQVTTVYCAPGETPAPDSAAADRARREAADGGVLATARFEGRRFCEPLRPLGH